MNAKPAIEPLGESALLLRLGDRIDPALNDRVQALVTRLQRDAPVEVVDLVPAYAALAVHFDGGARPAAVRERVEAWLRTTWSGGEVAGVSATRTVEIPVCYGGEHGPDLDALAAHAGLSPAEALARHAGASYRVAMLGFAPGFPYMLGLPEALAMPRLAQPRRAVPAGSVGIAGTQTGIYPQASPGGWRIIGRTPLRLFDAAREPPALLAPGDRVRFVAIDAKRFQVWPAS